MHADGVPKEGLRIPDVLVRIAELLLVRDKVSLYLAEREYDSLELCSFLLLILISDVAI